MNLLDILEKNMQLCKDKNRFKCGIYVSNENNKKLLMDLFKNISYLRIPNISFIISNQDIKMIFDNNGSYIRVVKANDSARGCRFHSIVIDNEINNEIIKCIILPKFTPYYYNNNFYNTNEEINNVIEYEPKYVNIEYSLEQLKRFKERYIMNNFSVFSTYGQEINSANLYNPNNYSQPFFTKDIFEDECKIMMFNSMGIPKETISYYEEFVNKTKQLFLVIKGEYNIEPEFSNNLNARIEINCNLYSGYKVEIKDGIVIVTLIEKENEKPTLINYSSKENKYEQH